MNKFSVTDINYVHLHFKKSKDLAPEGYRFLSNVHENDNERIKLYNDNNKYFIMPNAYNIYGDLIEDMMSVYIKI